MDDIKTDSPGHPSILSKSPYFTSFEDAENYMGSKKEKVSFVGEQDSEIDIVEGNSGIHLTAL